MSAIWTAAEAAAALGVATRGNWRAWGVSIDSRTCGKDDLFVALPGDKFDGHDYVRDVLKHGAAAALVSKSVPGLENDPRLLRVADTRAALVALGQAARNRGAAKIIGVTGSVGKTSVKEMLRQALDRFQNTHASVASYNNDIGVPLSLARMPRDFAFGVFEMGMNHSGEMGPLSRQVRPDIAIITNIEAVHLENFPSISAIADAKAEIFEGMDKTGAVLLNRDNLWFAHLRDAARAHGIDRVIGFGRAADAECRVIREVWLSHCSCVTANLMGQIITFKIGIPGKHQVPNALAVLGAAELAGGDVGLGALALGEMTALKGRGRQHRVTVGEFGFDVIDETYNASPVSIAGALEILGYAKPPRGGRKIAALGDMLELGEKSADLHAALAKAVLDNRIDLVYTAGPMMAHLAAALPDRLRGGHAENSEALASKLAASVRAGDVVMVKGSRGSRMEKVVDSLLALDSPVAAMAANG